MNLGKRRTGDRVFTMIELLTVIAVLLILIAMLLPTLDRARYQAALVVCAANFDQIGKASTLFAGDNNRFFPRGEISPANCSAVTNIIARSDMDKLLTYGLDDTRLWYCPTRAEAGFVTHDLVKRNRYDDATTQLDHFTGGAMGFGGGNTVVLFPQMYWGARTDLGGSWFPYEGGADARDFWPNSLNDTLISEKPLWSDYLFDRVPNLTSVHPSLAHGGHNYEHGASSALGYGGYVDSVTRLYGDGHVRLTPISEVQKSVDQYNARISYW